MSHDDSTSSSSSASSSGSSSSSSSDGRRRVRHRSRLGRRPSSSSSSSSGSSNDSEADESDEEEPSRTGISPLSCLLLVLIVAVAGGLAVFVFERTEGKVEEGGGTADGATSGTSTKKPASSVALSGAPAATSIPTDFLAALASSFSMTPAAVSSLPMPSSALPSSSAANSYIQEAWSVKKGSGPLSFVEDPLEGGGGLVLEVDYPKGSYSGAKDVVAGVGNMQMAVFGKSKQRAIVSYEVGFSAGFDFVKGVMWRAAGDGEVYAYIPTYDGQCSEKEDKSSYMCHGQDGVSIDRGSFVFEAGKWNTVTQVAVLNSDPGPSGQANGVLAVYAGETQTLYREDVVFRTNASVSLNAFIFSTFFGGSTEDYAATADCSTYYRNMQFFEGDDASTVQGETVQATADA
ncbi:hypothetical protein DMC30DRAFT_19102 [Rhodotorula diobovata]|uniref:Polysaccharide lyase 14 domain-containing protein n=1 Tax=Rhodotorula diobovata TaxID=5288 RepID=A0A5C5FS74_9BASI|nr:hypothetical protein DMC30DRAFT_19102 [Rhodotorula diobovata]